jgi:hypothetical protein
VIILWLFMYFLIFTLNSYTTFKANKNLNICVVRCFTVDLECLTKTQFPSMALLRAGGNFKRWGLGRSLGLWSMPLKELWDGSHFPNLASRQTGFFHHSCHHDALCPPQAQSNRANRSWMVSLGNWELR